MKPIITIDFVSDIACPWCAVGFGNLSQAMSQLEMVVDFKVHFRAFQLNPHMPPGGQDAMEHLTQKYGLSLDQVKTNQAQIRARALEAGFKFHPDGRNCEWLLRVRQSGFVSSYSQVKLPKFEIHHCLMRI